jgi:hypothetical protein
MEYLRKFTGNPQLVQVLVANHFNRHYDQETMSGPIIEETRDVPYEEALGLASEFGGRNY